MTGLCGGGVCWINPLPAGDFHDAVLLPNGDIHVTSVNAHFLVRAGRFTFVEDDVNQLMGVGDELWVRKQNLVRREPSSGGSAVVGSSNGILKHSADGGVWSGDFAASVTAFSVSGGVFNNAELPMPCNSPIYAPIGFKALVGCTDFQSPMLPTSYYEVFPVGSPRFITTVDGGGFSLTTAATDESNMLIVVGNTAYRLTLAGAMTPMALPGAASSILFSASTDGQLIAKSETTGPYRLSGSAWQQIVPQAPDLSGLDLQGTTYVTAGAMLRTGTIAGPSQVITQGDIDTGSRNTSLIARHDGGVSMLHSGRLWAVTPTGLTPEATFSSSIDGQASELPDGRIAVSGGPISVRVLGPGSNVQSIVNRARYVLGLPNNSILAVDESNAPTALTVLTPGSGQVRYDGGVNWVQAAPYSQTEVMLVSASNLARFDFTTGAITQLETADAGLQTALCVDGSNVYVQHSNNKLFVSNAGGPWVLVDFSSGGDRVACSQGNVATSSTAQSLWNNGSSHKRVTFDAVDVAFDSQGRLYGAGKYGQVIQVQP